MCNLNQQLAIGEADRGVVVEHIADVHGGEQLATQNQGFQSLSVQRGVKGVGCMV